jgi:hypothetical protein
MLSVNKFFTRPFASTECTLASSSLLTTLVLEAVDLSTTPPNDFEAIMLNLNSDYNPDSSLRVIVMGKDPSN